MNHTTTAPSRTNYFAIPGLIRDPGPTTTADEIIQGVAAACGYTTDFLMMVNRNRRRVAARYISMVLIRRLAGLSLKEVGQCFGKDHTTVIHAQEAVQNGVDTRDPMYMDLAGRIAAIAGYDIRQPSRYSHRQGYKVAEKVRG